MNARPDGAEDTVDPKRVVAFLAMVFGMFMAILDIQVVSASLPEIQAGLSASADEISWVQTSYLIAEVIMIPLSGVLGRALSTRWMFTLSAAGFTFMSFMCATATTMGQMIVYRALQGFIGGGMIPSVFAAAFSIFPRSKQATISPMIGLVATLAPTIGPTVGGYLTEYFSWHWLFLINIIPGFFVTLAAITLIDFDRPAMHIFKAFDWAGLILMAGFLGTLEYVLEEGPGEDWFSDDTIVTLTMVMVACAGGFFWRAFTAESPIVDLHAFRDRNFATGSIFSFVLGIGLYGLTYIYPQYLSTVRDMNALQIGETMFVTGTFMFMAAPISGMLTRRTDPRLMLTGGLLLFAIGTWLASRMTAEWDFWELFVPQFCRGVGLMFCMVPITNVALGTLSPNQMKNASGLFNLTRNLGGAVGLATITTIYDNRSDFHLERLSESVTWSRQSVLDYEQSLEQAMSSLGSNAQTAAIKELWLIIQQQAAVMAFADLFWLLTMLFSLTALGVFFMKKPLGGPASPP